MDERELLKNPIFVALDVDDVEKAYALAEKLAGKVGGFKVGPRLLIRFGPQVIEKLTKFGPVFVDNKYYDIPSTMVSAVRATFETGATFATIHAQCGSEALKALAELEKELNQQRPFRILAVTVLTSYSAQTVPPNWKPLQFVEHVEALADAVLRSGLSGLVCSPEEASAIRRRHPNSYLVTPGIRLTSDSKDDQARIMTPKAAIAAGASALVIGRPILTAQDPIAVVNEILSTLS